MRTGILGGSFDPVHRGHLALAREARQRLALDRVLLVVAARQPLKPEGAGASGDDRYAMVHLVSREEPWLEPSDLELRRGGPSFTVETLHTLRASAPGEEEFVLVLGADAFADFARWKSAAEIDALAEVAVFSRPGTALPAATDLAGTLGEERARALLESVRTADTPCVSSTEVRRRVAAGRPVDDLVTGDVAAYIQKRGLYRG